MDSKVVKGDPLNYTSGRCSSEKHLDKGSLHLPVYVSLKELS